MGCASIASICSSRCDSSAAVRGGLGLLFPPFPGVRAAGRPLGLFSRRGFFRFLPSLLPLLLLLLLSVLLLSPEESDDDGGEEDEEVLLREPAGL